jgi:hypothetical protein
MEINTYKPSSHLSRVVGVMPPRKGMGNQYMKSIIDKINVAVVTGGIVQTVGGGILSIHPATRVLGAILQYSGGLSILTGLSIEGADKLAKPTSPIIPSYTRAMLERMRDASTAESEVSLSEMFADTNDEDLALFREAFGSFGVACENEGEYPEYEFKDRALRRAARASLGVAGEGEQREA